MTLTTAMSAEIRQQPQALADTLETLVPLTQRLRTLASGRRMLFAARGSSDNAALYARYLLETHARVPCTLLAPSVATHYATPLDLSDCVVVSISQSGATEEIVVTQQWARSCGAVTIAVTNVEGSPLAVESDLALVTQAGPELAVPATKTYLCQLAAIAVLGAALGPEQGGLGEELRRAPDAVAALIENTDVTSAVRMLASTDEILVTGRGLVMGTALEVALKLEETCLRPVRGLSYADLRHGPISVVDDEVVAVLVAAADGPLLAGMIELAADLRGCGARLLGVGGDAEFAAACDDHLRGPALSERLSPLGLVVPMQLTVERLARVRGLDPDFPRGLSKVTQTDPANANTEEN